MCECGIFLNFFINIFNHVFGYIREYQKFNPIPGVVGRVDGKVKITLFTNKVMLYIKSKSLLWKSSATKCGDL